MLLKAYNFTLRYFNRIQRACTEFIIFCRHIRGVSLRTSITGQVTQQVIRPTCSHSRLNMFSGPLHIFATKKMNLTERSIEHVASRLNQPINFICFCMLAQCCEYLRTSHEVRNKSIKIAHEYKSINSTNYKNLKLMSFIVKN